VFSEGLPLSIRTGLGLKTKEGLKEYFAKVHDYACVERLKFAVEKALEILQE